ncbi:MAG: class I SAM-dependent methyltransferase [Planctomycetota bacterium]|nr:class I SAM-dependent methyltransferase [Planctomycetota bacterium]
MGDINQMHFLRKKVPLVDGPVLEIGSKNYGNTSSFRQTFTTVPYVGVDLADGLGVDVVADLTAGIGTLPENHFALAICCSVLEHVHKPWLMAENIARLVRPGGQLYVSVPWVWRYHPYPDDYFRFSFRAIKSLFEHFSWDRAYYSTTVDGEFFPIDEAKPGVDNTLAIFSGPNEQSKRKYLPYLMVNMIGRRLAQPATNPRDVRAIKAA